MEPALEKHLFKVLPKRIILFMYEKNPEPQLINRVRKGIFASDFHKISKYLNKFVKLGILTLTIENKRKYYSLTQKGLKLAEMINEIQVIISLGYKF